MNIPPKTYTPDLPLYNGGTGNIFNTGVYCDLDISNGSYIDYDGNIQYYDGITIPQVLISVQQTKFIVKTPIQGLNGTVKQFISNGDWVINIKGKLLGNNGVYPKALVSTLNSLYNAACSVQVNTNYLTQLGILNMVITDISLPQEMGKYSTQDFSMNALSDTPIELF